MLIEVDIVLLAWHEVCICAWYIMFS